MPSVGESEKGCSMKHTPKLSIIIPAHNEERRLPATLQALREHCDDLETSFGTCEIIIVDDGSRDATATIAGTTPGIRLIKNERNRGKGYSIRQGSEVACGEFLVFMDADLSVPLRFLGDMITLLQSGNDIVIGSRRITGAEIVVHQPFIREKLGQLFNIAIRFLGLSSFHDTQCGFKGFSREAARVVFAAQRTERFAFDVELLYIARQHGFRIAELAVEWFNSRETKVVTLLDPARMFLDVLRIRLNSWRGCYRKRT